MPVELYMSSEFDTPYEREALSLLLTDLHTRFGDTGNLCIVLANYFIQGHQIDITILKRDAIIIVELKDCSSPFIATENGSWQCPDGHIVGQTGSNPYHQVRNYRIKWKEFLANQKSKFKCLSTSIDDRPLWQTGVVAISPSLHPEVDNRILKTNKTWWFKLIGSDDLGRHVSSETNKYLNFSDSELRAIPALLRIMQAPVHRPVQAPVQAPVQKPVQRPVHRSAQAPIQAPVQARVHRPVQAAVKFPIWKIIIGTVAAISSLLLVAWMITALFTNGSRDTTLGEVPTSIPPPTPVVTTVISSTVPADLSLDPTIAIGQPVFHSTGEATIVDPPWYPCQERQIKGNNNSKIYHIPTGDFYNKTFKDVTCFNTGAEAEAAGFRAARN